MRQALLHLRRPMLVQALLPAIPPMAQYHHSRLILAVAPSTAEQDLQVPNSLSVTDRMVSLSIPQVVDHNPNRRTAPFRRGRELGQFPVPIVCRMPQADLD